MKTSELKKALEFMGFRLRDEEIYPDLYLVNWGDKICASISRKFTKSYQIINTDCVPNTQLLRTLQDILLDYSTTPIDERDNVNRGKKYYLQYRWFSCSSDRFLCYDKMIKGYYLRDFPKPTEHASYLKMLFTKQEIESIKERFSTILDDYEILEVEDENK